MVNTSDLSVSLDPYVLDVMSSKRRLKAIEQDGGLTYESFKSPDVKFTEQLERIWNEYPNGLLDLTEEKLSVADLPAAEDQVPKKTDQEEMEAMRLEVYEQLNNARNELWFALELAKTLSLSTDSSIHPPSDGLPNLKKAKVKDSKEEHKPGTAKVEDAPILPGGTFTTTQAVKSDRTTASEIQEIELALSAKRQAIEDCSALIDAAVEELQAMASGGDKFWDGVRKLQDGENGRDQWVVLPKPDFARTGEKAQDIVVPYAMDEAPLALRTRSLAAFDLDPSKDALTFGARSFSRLQVRIGDEISSIRLEGDRLLSKMEAVQLEAFDEDLFNEVRIEASRLGADMEPTYIAFTVGDLQVVFEVVDTRNSAKSTRTSPICDLVISSTRLALLQLHRQRKARLIGRPARRLSILTPILQLIEYAATSRRIMSTLETFVEILSRAGLAAHITSRWSTENTIDFLVGPGEEDLLGCAVSFDVQGCPGIRIDTSPTTIMFTSTSSTFQLLDLGELPHILADEITSQLVKMIVKRIKKSVDSAFLDVIEQGIRVSGLTLFVSVTPALEEIHGRVETNANETYNSRSGLSLLEWIDNVIFGANVG